MGDKRLTRAADQELGKVARCFMPCAGVIERQLTRNPLYLALCLVQTAIAFLLNDWLTLLFVVPLAIVLHFDVILPEGTLSRSKVR